MGLFVGTLFAGMLFVGTLFAGTLFVGTLFVGMLFAGTLFVGTPSVCWNAVVERCSQKALHPKAPPIHLCPPSHQQQHTALHCSLHVCTCTISARMSTRTHD